MATSPGDLEFLAGLLDGTVALDGLAVDTDLRWALLRRLVSRGVRGEEAIDAELSRDATDAGERQAAGCRAAIPTLTRQARDLGDADRREADDRHVPRHDHRVRRPGPAGARPAVPAGVLRRARRGVGASGPRRWRRTSCEYGYTIGAVDETTIAATDAYLASPPEPPAALRRLLSEGRDEVARALRNQSRDREAAS